MEIAKNVENIIAECLFTDEEIAVDNRPPDNAVIAVGIVRTFAFHPARLESHKAEIAALCDELPKEFRKNGGGGWSFLNLCQDKHGHQWGEHRDCEGLLALAMATGQGGYVMPRDMWDVLPGGMPYVWLGTGLPQ